MEVSWNASELNATDSDTNSAQLSWSLLSSPSNGTAVVDGNGSSPEVFTYQPDANYHGSDSFSLQVSDGDANDSITINLTINPVDDPSVISGDTSGVLNEDSSLTGDLNATDIDGLTDGSYFSISVDPSNGFAAIDVVDGNWTYFPSANFYGSDSFTVTITDDQGYTANQVINLSLIPTDDPSIISGDTNASLTEDSFASGYLNVTDIDGLTDGSYFSINSTPTNGTASIDPASGAWSYSPLANFHGSDSFTVTITDDQGYSTSQIISLTVTPVDDQTIVIGEFSGKQEVRAPNVSSEVYFCEERMPLEFTDIHERFDQELLRNTYWHSSTLLNMKRLGKYFDAIAAVFDRYAIPPDVRYLAIAESNLSNVVSPAGAAGYWQFMKATGSSYGLEITSEVDERYHFEKATEAACLFLQDLYQQITSDFPDTKTPWTLAAAAYNMGYPALKRAMTQQRVDNYYDLHLNRETARYVFRITAFKVILEHPEEFGYTGVARVSQSGRAS